MLFIALGFHTFAQETYVISGTVKDKNEFLPGAAVYVSGYKIATSTNGEGKFTLAKLAPGNYDILVQMIGYIPYSKNVVVSDKSINISIILTESTTQLNTVVIRPDPNRLYHISLFKDFFIGKTPNSDQCKILNLQVLTFNDDRAKRLLTANASDFLIIENKALGYKIKYLLEAFEYDYASKIIYYAGHPHFEELPGNASKQRRWAKARELAYNGSIQHFFKSLYDNTIAQQGFVINKLVTTPNPMRQPDSLINANVKRLTTGRQGVINTMTFNGNDSLSYWIRQRNLSKNINTLSRANVLVDTLVKKDEVPLKMMQFTDALFVIYNKEKEDARFQNSGNRQNRPFDIGDTQVSVINIRHPKVRFYSNGSVYDPMSTLYSGYWAYEKVADLTPLEYLPAKKAN